jgi:hypothetical protein
VNSPEEELFRVLESEHGIIILHVILIQKEMNLFTLLVILDIDQTPFESCW